jgi:hypothetical protein
MRLGNGEKYRHAVKGFGVGFLYELHSSDGHVTLPKFKMAVNLASGA